MKTRLLLAAAILPVMALAAGVSYKDVTGTVVSTDTASNMLTIKAQDGATNSAKVEGNASATLGTLHAGDKVVVTMKDSGNGEPTSVTGIVKSAE
jgi:translation initiation factor IF-1